MVAADGGHEALRRSFFEVTKTHVLDFLLRYRERVPELRRLFDGLGSYKDPEALIATLMTIVNASGHKLYVTRPEVVAVTLL